MYRVAFAIDDSHDRQDVLTALRRLTIDETRIVAAFADPKAVEIYIDIPETAIPREVAGQLARHLGITEYEVTRVDEVVSHPEPAEPESRVVEVANEHLRRAVITQVSVRADGRTLSVQARHRAHETVERVALGQDADAVTIAVLVAPPHDDPGREYVSFAIEFTWVETVLDQPLGERRIVRDDPEHGVLKSRTPEPPVTEPHDDTPHADLTIDVAAVESEPVELAEPTPEEILARLECIAARVRAHPRRELSVS